MLVGPRIAEISRWKNVLFVFVAKHKQHQKFGAKPNVSLPGALSPIS